MLLLLCVSDRAVAEKRSSTASQIERRTSNMQKFELEGHLVGLHVKEQEVIISQSEELCATILKIVKSDVLSVETEHFADSTSGSRSTVSARNIQ